MAMTRRDFLKGMIAAGALAGLSGCIPNPNILRPDPILERTDGIARKTLFNKQSYTGMDLNVIPLKRAQTQAFVATQFGSDDTKFYDSTGKLRTIAPGSAHFFEHVKFKRPNGVDLKDEFRKIGSYTNAYTSRTHTAYQAVLTDNLEDNLRILFDMACVNDGLNAKNISDERGIIGEEWRMNQDKLSSKLWRTMLGALYFSSYGDDSLGSPEDIAKNINIKDLKAINEVFYHPANMFMVVVGNQDPEEVFDLAEKIQKEYGLKHGEAAPTIWYDEPAHVKNERIDLKLPISYPFMRVAFKRDIPKEQNFDLTFKESMLTNMVLDSMFGKSSNFYNDLYMKGLVNPSFSAWHYNGGRNGFSGMGGMTSDAAGLEEEIYKEIKKVQTEGIDKDAFRRNKKSLMGGIKWLYNTVDDTISTFSHYEAQGGDLLGYLGIAKDFTVEDGNRNLQKYFDLNGKNRSVVVAGP